MPPTFSCHTRRLSTTIMTAVVLTTVAASCAQAATAFNPSDFKPIAAPRISTKAANELPRTAPTKEVSAANQVATLTGGTSSSTQSFSTLAALTRYQISTQSNYVVHRGNPGGMATGLARNGWGIDVATSRNYENWRFGYITGGTNVVGSASQGFYQGPTVERCLWVEFERLASASTSPTKDCTNTPGLNEADYVFVFNGNRDGTNCFTDPQGKYYCDGTPVQIDAAKCPGGAPVMGNVQPWNPLKKLWGDYLYTIPPSTWIRWRYITKDLQFTMIRNPNTPVIQDWGFIPSTCITQYGYTQGPRPPGSS
jgi:hypothetical protein